MKKAVFISCFFEKQNPRPLIFYKYLSDVFKTTVVTMDYNHVTKQPVLPPRQQSFAAKKRAFIKQDAVGSEKQPAPDTVYVPVIKYKSNLSPFRMLSHLLFSLHLKKIILREKPDFVYVNFPPNSSAYFAARAAKKCGAALMCDLTDLWPEALPFRGLLKRVVNFTAGHFWRWLRNKA
ncbi:MAG: hypothetical protein LBQ48_01880, partial [Oscillospiraceae bacterium]|nr:hypothetical protein [Oscillospiraceae bacterium]